jgi:hypothetical protein
MRTFNLIRTLVVAVAALATISCAKQTGGGTSSSGSDNGNVTSVNPEGTTPPPPSSVSKVPAAAVPVPSGTNPQTAPSPDVETPVTLPSPAVLQAVSTTQGKLDALTASIDGARVRFVDCTDTASCTARLEAQSLAGLRDLLQSVSQQQGGIGFVAREQLDAYAGRTFVADVTLGTATTRPVPADESALLMN